MRFFVKNRSTTDRKGIVKDDSLDRDVGFGQIEENSISNSTIINSNKNGYLEKIIIKDIENCIFNDNRNNIIEKNNKTFIVYDESKLEKIRDNDRIKFYEKYIKGKIDNEKENVVAIAKIYDYFWECSSFFRSRNFFDYMRILFGNLSSH